MDWIYTHVLLPVLGVLYVPCDWVLGWTERFSPFVAITIVGVISALAIILVQKYGSDQTFLGACKADLKFLKKRMKEAKRGAAYYSDDGENITIDPSSLSPANLDILTRARALSGRIGGKYMWASLKPALWTVPLIGVIGLWTGSRLGYVPIRPGQEIAVAAHFEDQAKGFAYVLPTEGLRPVTAPIAAIEIPQDGGGLQARWKLRAEKEGDHRLTVRGAGRSYDVTIPVAAKGGRPPEPVTVLNDLTPGQDQLQAVEIKLADSLPAAWWNLKMQWGGLYLIVAVGMALVLRSLLGVH